MSEPEILYFDDDQRPTEVYPSPEQILMWCEEAEELK